jgi:response regulator RpfG family c-di-GMP phosphodiesterase
MSQKILFVDDDLNILQAFQRQLRKHFTLDTAPGGREGLEMLAEHGPYAVVVADMRMPEMDGIEFLIQVAEKAPDTVRMMLTGNADQQTAAEAVNKGQVFQFLTKPCPPESLRQVLENGLNQHRLIRAEKELLENTLNGSIRVLTDILSMVDTQAFGRGQKLKEYLKTFADSFQAYDTWELELAAMLSPIGYVTIPAELMLKVRSDSVLSSAEKDILARVPEVGSRLIESIPRLDKVARIVHYQNKNYDGSGFPPGSVKGEEIPIGSRILKILVDLIRYEDQGLPRFKALGKLQSFEGLYDPDVLKSIVANSDVPEVVTKERLPIEVHELRISDILASDIETSEGLRLVGAGTTITQLTIEQVHNFNRIGGIKTPIFVLAEPTNA